MTRKSKKYTILGGVKVSSRQLAEWGSSGGRPKKYASNAEKQRAYKLRKKQARLGPEAQLEPRKSYHDIEKITRYGRCRNCGLTDNMGGAYTRSGWERFAWTAGKSSWVCHKCYLGSMEKVEVKEIIPRAGTDAERQKRFYDKSKLNLDDGNF